MMEIEKKKTTNVNIYLMYFFASKQRRKRWTFLLFISNYVLGLIVSVATSRGHTHTCVSGDEVEGRGSDSDHSSPNDAVTASQR